MAGGFNSDVGFDGVVFHVQSEDRGIANPVLETLVYCGGQILHQERSSYVDLLAQGGEEEEVQRRLERQHRDVLRRTRHGEFNPGKRRTLVERLVGVRELPELFGDEFLRAGMVPFALRFEGAVRGHEIGGVLHVRRATDREPVSDGSVTMHAVGRDMAPHRAWSGETDELGRIAFEAVTLPASADAVVFRAFGSDGAGTLRLEAGKGDVLHVRAVENEVERDDAAAASADPASSDEAATPSGTAPPTGAATGPHPILGMGGDAPIALGDGAVDGAEAATPAPADAAGGARAADSGSSGAAAAADDGAGENADSGVVESEDEGPTGPPTGSAGKPRRRRRS